MDELTPRQQEILDLICQAIAKKGIPPTIAEIADAIGVSSSNGVRGHLQALERKGAINLIAGARGIQLNPALLNQVVKRGSEDISSTDGRDGRDGRDEEELASNGLPIIGQVAAGSPILAQAHIEDYCQVDAQAFHPRADYLLRVKGESMRDVGILDGDLLAVHRTKIAKNGQIVVARLDDEVTVKRLRQEGQMVFLMAENPDYAPIAINLKTQKLDIEGIAVGIFRKY